MRDPSLALLCVVSATGCLYDWSTSSGSSADAAADVAVATDARLDGPGPADASPETTGPGPDVAVDTAAQDATDAASLPPCTAGQEQTIHQARTAALVCTGVMPSPCETTMDDECGCPVVVADSAAKQTYSMAISQLLSTCVPSCPGCGPTPAKGVCVLGDAGAGMLACYQ